MAPKFDHINNSYNSFLYLEFLEAPTMFAVEHHVPSSKICKYLQDIWFQLVEQMQHAEIS